MIINKNQCPHCGASLNIAKGEEKFRCEHCQTILADAWFKKGIEELRSSLFEYNHEKLSLEIIEAWKLAFDFAEDPETMKRNIILEAYDAIVIYNEQHDRLWQTESSTMYSKLLKTYIFSAKEFGFTNDALDGSEGFGLVEKIGKNRSELDSFGNIFNYLIQLDKTKEVIKYYLDCVQNMYSLINDEIDFFENFKPSMKFFEMWEKVNSGENYYDRRNQLITYYSRYKQKLNEEKNKYQKLLSEIDPKTEDITLKNMFEKRKLEKKLKTLEKKKKNSPGKFGCLGFLIPFSMIILICIIDESVKFGEILGGDAMAILAIGLIIACIVGPFIGYFGRKNYLRSKEKE